MSIKGVIYDLLANNPALNERLARSNVPGAEAEPAIYDRWPADEAAMPYIIHSWRFPPGPTWGQVNAALSIDIFTNEGDTLQAEEIRDIVIEALAWGKYYTPDEGHISIYIDGMDQELPEPEPEVVHWQTEFLVRYWRQKLISAINK